MVKNCIDTIKKTFRDVLLSDDFKESIIGGPEKRKGKENVISIPSVSDDGIMLEPLKGPNGIISSSIIIAKIDNEDNITEIYTAFNSNLASKNDVNINLDIVRNALKNIKDAKIDITGNIGETYMNKERIFDNPMNVIFVPKFWNEEARHPNYERRIEKEAHAIFMAREISSSKISSDRFLPFSDMDMREMQNKLFEIMPKMISNGQKEIPTASYMLSVPDLPDNIRLRGNPDTEILATPAYDFETGKIAPLSEVTVEPGEHGNIKTLSLVPVKKYQTYLSNNINRLLSYSPLTTFPKIGERQTEPLEITMKGPINEVTLFSLANHPQKNKIARLNVHESQRAVLNRFAKAHVRECEVLPPIFLAGRRNPVEWVNAPKAAIKEMLVDEPSKKPARQSKKSSNRSFDDPALF